ncbi:hypothetical protein [Iodidimonas sp. SYSU 1G8]|uniref:hypothetical protein n=1 Tax=Iodidimonas sp. SYSU 1G8 TaxID=3133967 RepID=UPI0031FE7F17
MQIDQEPVKPGSLALRGLILPVCGSALVALGVGMTYACGPVPGIGLLAAPALAAVGAVGGPERKLSSRFLLGAVSTALNLLVMLMLQTAFSWKSCGYL